MIGEEEMIVWNSVADGIVRANDVDEGSEKRQRVTIIRRREVRDPFVWLRVGVGNFIGNKEM